MVKFGLTIKYFMTWAAIDSYSFICLSSQCLFELLCYLHFELKIFILLVCQFVFQKYTFSCCFLKSSRCSASRIRADRPVSPSYTLLIFLSLQVTQSHLYPTLFVLQGIFTSSESITILSLCLYRGHVFCTHFDFLKGF